MLKDTAHAPLLLTMPDYNGTLAAMRCVGRQGVSVTLAGGEQVAAGRWSRYVTRHVEAPHVRERARFVDWLLAFGARCPGHVLYPTSDDMSWLMATHADALRADFHLYQPQPSAIFSLLDKRVLFDACVTLGIDAPPSFFPDSAVSARAIANELGFPLLLKPRTQAFFDSRSKGALVQTSSDFDAAWQAAVSEAHYDSIVLDRLPDAALPVLQAYRPSAQSSIYSVAGFVSEEGQHIVARASVKVLQRPRKLGVGLCFEHAPLNAFVLQQLQRLCQHVGYFGVFEAEFIQDEGRYLLIDFNPRFYGQMGFEVERQLPLAYMAYLGALQSAQLLPEVLKSTHWQPAAKPIFTDEAYLRLVLFLRSRLAKGVAGEVAQWHQWLDEGRQTGALVDTYFAADDRLPGYVALLRNSYRAMRHGRSFLRTMILD